MTNRENVAQFFRENPDAEILESKKVFHKGYNSARTRIKYRIPELEADAYEVVSQSSHETKGDSYNKKQRDGSMMKIYSKFHTQWSYNAEGTFDNQPKVEKLELMIRNSIIGAFGRSVPENVLNTLVQDGIRGIEIRPVMTSKNKVNNRIKLKIEIQDKLRGGTWSNMN
tara:strand:- start:1053 stop:1559 length:507 start_codon:yes stop_codon:yes gene_type:complete